MTTFSSQDFQQVFGTHLKPGFSPHTVPSVTGSTPAHPAAYPEINWPPASPGTIPYEPVVTQTPEQKALIERLENMTKAIKHDSGKADWSLMPWEAVEEINKVLEFGANKYAAHNWQQGEGFRYTRVLNSLLRHVFAYMRGEDLDPESGLSHMAHAGCNVLFILYYIKNKSRYKNDDRYVQ